MKRTMIYLSEDQYESLMRLSKRDKKPMARQVREAVELYLKKQVQDADLEKDPLWGLPGIYRSGKAVRDAEEHDRVLIEAKVKKWKRS